MPESQEATHISELTAVEQIERLSHELKHMPRGELDPALLKAANAVRVGLKGNEHQAMRELLAILVAVAAAREDSAEFGICVLRDEVCTSPLPSNTPLEKRVAAESRVISELDGNISLLPMKTDADIHLNILYLFLRLQEEKGRPYASIQASLTCPEKISRVKEILDLPDYRSSGWRPLRVLLAKVLSSDGEDREHYDWTTSPWYWSFVAIVCLASWYLTGLIEIRVSDANGHLQLAHNWFVVATGRAWPVALVGTWLVLFGIARRRGVSRSIDLSELLTESSTVGSSGSLIVGQYKPFLKDHFFSIHHFIWIPFAYVTLHAIHRTTRLIESAIREGILPSPSRSDDLRSLLESTSSLAMDPLWWIPAVGLVAFVTVSQIRVQRARIRTGTTIYWWDWRIDRGGYILRLVMLWIDYALLTLIIAKLLAIVWLVVRLGDTNLLNYLVTDPSGLGGLSGFADVVFSVDVAIIILGMFIAASAIMHRGMPQYRLSDTLALSGYIVIALLVFFLPLHNIHQHMADARDELVLQTNQNVETIVSELEEAGPEAAARYATALQALQARRTYLLQLATWPFDIEMLIRVVLGVLSPIGIIIASFIEGLTKEIIEVDAS